MASQRKLDSTRRVGGKIIEQGQPAFGGLIRRYRAEFLMMRLRRFNMNIADRRRKMTCRSSGESPTHSQLPISNVKVIGS